MSETHGGGVATRLGGAAPTGRLACPCIAIKAKLQRFVRVSMMRRAHHFPPHILFCPVGPRRPLWSGDGLGVPDTVLDHAGRKGPLGHTIGAGYMSDVP